MAMVKPIAFRILLAITVYYNLDINQIAFKLAFLYGMINQLIYMQILKRSKNFINKEIICKLLKTFHGIKKALKL